MSLVQKFIQSFIAHLLPEDIPRKGAWQGGLVHSFLPPEVRFMQENSTVPGEVHELMLATLSVPILVEKARESI